jgi:predicted phage tail protein
MKKIKLFGDLQVFKADWELDVKTPNEALRAIEANRPGFLKAADAGEYVAILIDEKNPDLTRQVTLDNNFAPWADEILCIIPRAGGEVAAPMLMAMYGMSTAAIAAASTATMVAFSVAAMIINIGISLAVSALANMITGKKQSVRARDTETYESKPSFISNGPVNVVRAGHPYPIIAGRFLCGAIVVSSQIHVKDIPI